jgi:hypothetical protein
MRAWTWLAALVAAPLLAAPAPAQHTVGFGGADPTKRVNVPTSVPNVAGQDSQPQNPLLGMFSLANFLPHIPLPLGKPVLGQSSFPTQQNMPGKAYLQNFGYQRAQPIQ